MGKGDVGAATDAVKKRLGNLKPRVAIVLGSGLGFLADEVDAAIRIPYSTIPGFPEPGVAGHKGELVAGTLEGVPVIVQAGRFHLYEGHSAAVAGLPARVFAELGVQILVVTNAAGGVRRTFPGGTLMLIADHINLMWRNPLIGQSLPGEQRFPIMHEPYDGELRALAREVAREAGVPMEEGVYVGLLGPSYEPPSEVRMLAPDSGIRLSGSITLFTRTVFPDFEGPESEMIIFGMASASRRRSSNLRVVRST